MRCAPLVALAAAALAGCSEQGGLPGLGEACTVFCAPGLSCSRGYCEKGCRCDRDAGSSTCTPSALAAGCPGSAACVVKAPSGEGMCVARCGDLGCPAGQGACASAPDGTPLCVGPDYPWVGADASSPADGP